MNLLKPSSREHALQILQKGLNVQPGSFNEVFPQSEDGRMSFNENAKRRAHPKVPNIFDKPIKEQFTPPPLFSVKSAKQQSKQLIQIPELPQGRIIDIKILSNWGDKNHYGLNGIELFDSSGGNITRYVRIPPQEDYEQKLRLVDGYQAVQDENHMFLVGRPPKIRIDLTAKIRLSLIRIWNYNKSRIHSYKGVRKIQIYMDDNIMFQGDIRKASGDLKKFQDNCEYILFTEDERIIKKINDNDWLNQRALDYSVQILRTTVNFDRPNTGQKQELSTQPDTQNTQYPYIELYDLKFEFYHTSSFCIGAIQIFDNFGELVPVRLNMHNLEQLFKGQIINLPFQNKKQLIHVKFDQINKISFIRFYQHQNGPQLMKLYIQGKSQTIYLRPSSNQKEDYQTIFLTNLQKPPTLQIPPQMHFGILITINLVSTWGDMHYIGLNGLEIYNEQGQAVLFRNLASHKIQAVPELMGDARVVKNLCRPPYGKDCQPQQSFLAPYMNTPQEWLRCKQEQILNEKVERTDINKIFVLFENYVAISQIDFFNYSKNVERGVKEVHIYINNKIVFQGYLRRFDGSNNKTSVVFFPLQKLQPSLYQIEQTRVQCINEGKALYVEKKINYEMTRPGTCVK